MSKKMFKRSLALGALMAFVITGQAWAAELNINYEDGTYTATGTGISNNITASSQDELLQSLVDVDWGKYDTSGGAQKRNIKYFGGNSSGNKVFISNVELDGDGSDKNYFNITGGIIEVTAGDADNNYVELNNTKINRQVVGGYAYYDGNAKNNVVKLNKAYGSAAVYAGSAWLGNAEENKLEIILGDEDLDLRGPKGNESYGGYSYRGDAIKNEVIVTSEGMGNLTGRFNGGCAVDGNADNNIVTLNNVTMKISKDGNGDDTGSVYGGLVHEDSSSGDAINNGLIINGGDIEVITLAGGKTFDGAASGNFVTINGATIDGDVYGGRGKTEANNNTVNISGEANMENASLFGGFVTSKTGTSEGNTLNIGEGWSGKIKSIQNFNAINIEEAQWGEVAIEVTDTLDLDDTTVKVDTVRVAGSDTSFAPNGTSTLVSAGSITGELATDSSVSVFKGVATVYNASVVKDGNSINIQLAGEDTATYNAGEMNPQVLVIGESRAAATAFTNQGSDLIETGLDALARDKVEADTKVFAAVYGSEAEYATGSEVKVNGWSGIVGVGKTNANGLTVGAFFENGEGNYRTYNDVNGEFMRGDGDACYNGGGFLVRKDNTNGVYTEASLRAGNLQNELRNAVRGSEGLTGYDIDTFYYGAHIGVGKIIPRGNDGDSIDVYGKFIYTHHDSEDFTIDGDRFHFDSVDSERLRLGFRINEVQTNKLSMYYGAAWEYEFGGDSDNTVVGYDLSTPSLGGSSIIGELGMHYTASEKWSFDLNARAYGGQRDGFSGSVQANYAF